MPSNNYTVDIRTSRNTRILVKVIMVDTNAICGEDKIKKPYMNQIEAILQETRRINISFVIVVGHGSILGEYRYANMFHSLLNNILILRFRLYIKKLS